MTKSEIKEVPVPPMESAQKESELRSESQAIFADIAELRRQLRVKGHELGRVNENHEATRHHLLKVAGDVAHLQNKYNSMTFWQRLKWAFTHK